MELIITHTRADFDAFASMLLAGKLFPEATPVLPSTTVYKLREVQSLYRDVADFKNVRFLNRLKHPAINRVIVVDTKKTVMLKEFVPYLEMAGRRLLIFDHHPPTSDDLTQGKIHQYEYGANATGLFLDVQAKDIPLTPEEATIVMLGIYADTGNLTYPGTTAEDALAVGELLRRGADLQTVNYYLRPYFDPAQRFLLRDMLASLEEMNIEGYKVVLIRQEVEAPIQGLSVLLSNVSDMVGADAILGVFSTRGKSGVQIIIQSVVPEINAGEMAALFEGGGHSGAAAAFIPRAKNAEAVADTLLTLLTEAPLPTTKVKDVMSREVITIPADLPLHQTAERLIACNIHGAPVLNDTGQLVGVISLRDVEKARVQNLLHVPTSGFMSHKVVTIEPDVPLITAKKIISSHDIGRIPVLEEDRLAGIISRADILRAVNGVTAVLE